MDSFRFALSFALIVFLSFLLTFYIYFRLSYGVKKNREVPRWIYKFGQAFQGRVHVEYENATTSAALRDANLFLFLWLLVDVLSFAFLYFKNGNPFASFYQCCKLQFLIVLLAMMLHSLFQFFRMALSSSKEARRWYSTSNALSWVAFFSGILLSSFVSTMGFPERPITAQIDGTKLVVGSTKASSLIDAGFSFTGKSAESKITNKRNDPFYYGEYLEITRDGKSYGFMSVTPTWKDEDTLKNCTITYYEIPGDCAQLAEVQFNRVNLTALSLSDFQTRKITDIFSLKPANYKEIQNESYYVLTMQTKDYALWKNYSLYAYFDANGVVFHYGIRAQQSIWE